MDSNDAAALLDAHPEAIGVHDHPAGPVVVLTPTSTNTPARVASRAMTPDELDMLPARLSLADLERYIPIDPPVATFRGLRRSRSIWRGVDGGQSVLMLQVMGQMWSRWDDWGDLPE